MKLHRMRREELAEYLQNRRMCDGWIISKEKNPTDADGYPNGLFVGVRSLHEFDGFITKNFEFFRLAE